MKIFKIQVENYRLLKHFSIDLENELSLVIGKNNTGKTSILSILEKFLNQSERNKFYFDDFNIDFKKELKGLIEGEFITKENYKTKGIKMRLFIQYTENCNLENISRVMMDLDPENNYIVLEFEYLLPFEKYIELKGDYIEFSIRQKEKQKKDKSYKKKNLNDLLREKHANYFKIYIKSIGIDKDTQIINEANFIDLKEESINIRDIINFKFISAKREVANKDVDKTLSSQTSKIYEKTEVDTEQQEAIEEFQDRLSETDNTLTEIYNDKLFSRIIKKISDFGGIRPNESEIEIISNLQHRELLSGNTTVVYRHNENDQLPEHYNGLGYMNLICMIFEIEILIQEFKREKEKRPADINLLFIEEPEAHTHPQMQYIFIKNIKRLLKEGIQREDGEHRNLQYIISSHSSHIVSDCNFDDIKYLKKESSNSVIARNLKDLKKEYEENGEEQNFKFLKQYLTLNRAELFFAEKAVFVEGETERILLPAMMKKIDQMHPNNPLLSQNISIVEVGAHSKIFEKFIDFIGLKKGLIITDIDSYYLIPDTEDDNVTQKKYKNGNLKFTEVKCAASDSNAQYTRNSSLMFFHKNNTKENSSIDYYNNLKFDWKILRKKKNKGWCSNRKANLLICYQTKEDSYIPRSFEDAFFVINKDFIIDPNNHFESLTIKWVKDYSEDKVDSFRFSEKAVTSKPSLAIEILLNSKNDVNGNEFTNWEIPVYIKEGLLWLKQD